MTVTDPELRSQVTFCVGGKCYERKGEEDMGEGHEQRQEEDVGKP